MWADSDLPKVAWRCHPCGQYPSLQAQQPPLISHHLELKWRRWPYVMPLCQKDRGHFSFTLFRVLGVGFSSAMEGLMILVLVRAEQRLWREFWYVGKASPLRSYPTSLPLPAHPHLSEWASESCAYYSKHSWCKDLPTAWLGPLWDALNFNWAIALKCSIFLKINKRSSKALRWAT